ncbi:Hydroxyacyl-thioester dehydratase type 2 [Wickerhamomyces ciferrii]|uniref:Hydroxyacyl-thioester dehydratase type 2 n=1 Tax=Wickerhamomyces ciferrii (strain ATCC 14091 / BCRC 22168 / CBS 111 / JCM 3599 / NBRC 0793 / NRRL Y-1031 F-60-10) TaxID=1206466 RepID=K0KVS0_WICCF|nr:Hydroxyacyl-thioester dehydratase type 2 [Wickerhamomyces ciferrii]CCH45233.1 Hydroxyacyl-thioester dehydratase type 2 [Wickerhamomyces ciferrii]
MSTRKWILMDKLSSTHSQYLKASLYSYFNVQKPLGKFLPNGYHLLYFNPKHEETELSKDGYDSHQEPNDFQFKRRLWAGGKLDFIKPIEYNQESVCVESILASKKLGNNHIITTEREVISQGDISLIEKRTLAYTTDLYKRLEPQYSNKIPLYTHELKPTDTLLLRYSGLTFNSHKIHYNKTYAKQEGYPTTLVHGPLSITLLLEWVDSLFGGLIIKSFQYKNIAPLFANETLKLALSEDSHNKFSVWIENSQGELCVNGTIEVEEIQ